MEQYIKIKAKDDEGNPLGTFRIYIEFDYSTASLNSIVDSNKEIPLDGSIYNIPSNSIRKKMADVKPPIKATIYALAKTMKQPK